MYRINILNRPRNGSDLVLRVVLSLTAGLAFSLVFTNRWMEIWKRTPRGQVFWGVGLTVIFGALLYLVIFRITYPKLITLSRQAQVGWIAASLAAGCLIALIASFSYGSAVLPHRLTIQLSEPPKGEVHLHEVLFNNTAIEPDLITISGNWQKVGRTWQINNDTKSTLTYNFWGRQGDIISLVFSSQIEGSQMRISLDQHQNNIEVFQKDGGLGLTSFTVDNTPLGVPLTIILYIADGIFFSFLIFIIAFWLWFL